MSKNCIYITCFILLIKSVENKIYLLENNIWCTKLFILHLWRIKGGLVRVMVFNATFNTFSVISWRSVLLLEETGVYPEKATDRHGSKKQILFLIEISGIFHPVMINYRIRFFFLMFHVNLLFFYKNYVDRNSAKRHSP